MSWVDLDGELMPATQARIPVLNHGFLFGDSIYDVIRTYDGRPSLVGAHLDRLERSAAKIGLAIPITRGELIERIERAIERGGFDETYIRIIISRGEGPPNIDPAPTGPPRVIVLIDELTPPSPQMYRSGVQVVLVGCIRTPQADIKSGNYLNSIIAVTEAHARGAYEGLMLNAAGYLTEASTSNVFMVKDGTLATPELASGILEGITRGELVRVAAAAGIPVEERRMRAEELLGADEAFLSSTIKEVLPISHVDDTPMPACPGPITLRLLELYRERVGPLAP